MLKKITEPQALYQKSGGKQPAGTPTMPNKQQSSNKKTNWKIVGSILVVSIVAIVGVAGVLIAQRQRQVEGPVTPNAPSSQPRAAIPEADVCALGFSVSGKPATASKCVSKTVSKVVGTTKTPLAANTKVNRGDKLEYTITVLTSSTTTEFDVSDKMPAQLTMDTNSLKVDKGSIGASLKAADQFTANVTVPSGIRGTQIKVTYQATVKANATIANFTNAAKVVSNGETDTSCKITLGINTTPVTPPPSSPPPVPTGVAACEAKTAYNITTNNPYTTKGTNVSAVKRGDTIEYRINVVAEKTTKGAVVVKDTLPPELEYVANSSSWQNTVAPSGTSNVITFNMGTMAQSGVKQNIEIKYRARVKADADIGTFVNQVSVTTATDAPISPAVCRATLTVAPEGVAQCTEKTVLNASGTALEDKAEVNKGDILTYRIRVTADQQTAGAVRMTDVLPSSVTYDSGITPNLGVNGRTISADLGTMGTADSKTKTVEFKVKVNDNAPAGDIINEAVVSTGGTNSNACPATVRIEYACNIGCTTDEQCKSIGSGYICSIENGNTCRLASNPGSSSCQEADQEYACNSSCENDSQCQDVDDDYICAPTSEGDRCRHKNYPTQSSCEAPPTNSTPTPTPTIGCNALCVSNADCVNPDHICSTTSDGSDRCRLAEYPEASNCVVPGTPVAYTQPDLPEELPQTGPKDWVNWLKAGLITLGIGAVLLLLL